MRGLIVIVNGGAKSKFENILRGQKGHYRKCVGT